ncbi:MAG: carboxypeptidase regulatory-like domain-containing protein [Nocardioidaceae bacterium]|nr:carboxypeptidase regulatory-like domain-containing protein [Nocardioidaceae bacterium]
MFSRSIHRSRAPRRTGVLALVLAMVAGLAALTASSAGAVETRTHISGIARLSSGSATYGEVGVYLKDPDPATSYQYVDSYGFYDAFDVDLEPGTYKFEFYSYDASTTKWYATGTDTGTDVDHATPVTLTTSPKNLGTITFPVRTITVTAKDQHGTPLPGMEINAEGDTCDYWAGYGTNASGVAVLRNVPIDCEILLNGLDGSDHRVYDNGTATVLAGTGNATVNLTMSKLSTISGKVTNAANGALGLVDVNVYDDLGHQVGGTVTDSQGNYTLTGLVAGDYRLEFADEVGDYKTEYWNDRVDLATADAITVAANADVTGKNAVLTPVDTTTPSGVDLTGVVSGAGKPLSNVEVSAYRNGVYKGSATTRRDGRYTFDGLTAGSYKLQFRRLSGPADELPYVVQWYLNTRSSGASTPITVTPDSPGADRNVTLQQYGTISGVVTNNANQGIEFPSVDAIDTDLGYVDAQWMPTSTPGAYKLAVPPGSYLLRFTGWDAAATSGYVPEFWDNSSTVAGAKLVTVGSGGARTGINAKLTNQLEPRVAPAISGKPLVGQTLTASTGTWNVTANNDYLYQWYRGVTPVGTGASYKLTTADVGSKISVKVTAWHFQMTGSASSAATAPVKRPSVIGLTATSPKSRTVKLVVKVAGTGLANPGGTVTIKRGTTVVKSSVAVVNGVATITLAKQPAGARTYQAFYSGTSGVAAGVSPKRTVTVKR